MRPYLDIFARMQLNTVIFDMDGLLIDSEPLWHEAANDAFQQYGIILTPTQYAATTGLRTKEFVAHWFRHFNWPETDLAEAEKRILHRVIGLVRSKGQPMPGVAHIFDLFAARNFKIGLATSSGMELVEVVVEKLGIGHYLQAISSASGLPLGKPHPQVYLDCAEKLGARSDECLCFEDSVNGMIAAKAARMKCVVVPSAFENHRLEWHTADLKISSLVNFNELLLQTLG